MKLIVHLNSGRRVEWEDDAIVDVAGFGSLFEAFLKRFSGQAAFNDGNSINLDDITRIEAIR